MPKVLAVNNYPTMERFSKLKAALEENGAEVSVADWTSVSANDFDSYDGVALSGSPDMLSKAAAREKFSGEIQAIRNSTVPILGVCYGHQLIAIAYGSSVVEDSQHVLDFVKTDFFDDDPLFVGLQRPAMLLESRHEVVQSLPDGFRLLARSSTTPIASMKHKSRLLYGVQSHPERYSSANPDGFRLVGNFVSQLK